MDIKKIGLWVLGIGGAIAGLIYLNDTNYEEFSHEWLGQLSDEDLDTEREKVRLRHCSGDEKAQGILYRFDDEMRKRWDKAHANDVPKNPGYRWTDANRWDRD